MTRIAFIGLGNMGGGMAANQAKAGHEVAAYNLSAQPLEKATGRAVRAAWLFLPVAGGGVSLGFG